MSRAPVVKSMAIPGIHKPRVKQLEQLWSQQPPLQEVFLLGSRAIRLQLPGSGIDLCLEGSTLSRSDRLQLMAAADALLLHWRVDLVLFHELPVELEAHVQRMGSCIWRKA